MSPNTSLQLNAEEQRVLGALIEKSRATPDYYPLTLNSLVAACNQKTSRYPIVQYDEGIVLKTLDSLRLKGLTSTVTGGSGRVVKYKHNLAIQYPLLPSDLAIICVLLLRGPQTPGEINNNSTRLYEFESIQEVVENLKRLSEGETAFVKLMERQAGQKEARYIHLMGDIVMPEEKDASHSSSNSELAERVSVLEAELSELKTAFNNLMKELS